MRKAPDRLVYLSPVPLTSFAQRPHHFVHWFHARTGGPVLWIDPGPSRLPRLSDWRRLRQLWPGARPTLAPPWRQEPWLTHLRARVLPLEPFAWGRLLNGHLWKNLLQQVDSFITKDTLLVFGKPCALSIELAARYPVQHLIFDAMDHMPGFCTGVSRRWMLEAENELALRVHTLWASSQALLQLHPSHAHKSHLVLNALTPVSDLPATPSNPKPVLGYLGVIDRWFDWQRVIALATAHPWLEVRLVGPVHVPAPMALPTNIRCQPAVPQHRVYEVMAGFDAGLIPFSNDQVSAYVDPVKYYEYRALGLPVLSTSFGQMRHRAPAEGVWPWDHTLAGGAPALQKMLAARTTAAQQQDFRHNNSWSCRFDAVAHTLGLSRPKVHCP